MKALLVEDSRAMRAFMSSMVRKLGLEVHEAEHGLDALQQLEALDPLDVLLVDWNMPEMNGFELVKHLRADEQYASLRILMVTSESDVANMVSALEAGADEYLMKPFSAAELEGKLIQIGVLKGEDRQEPRHES
jgi:two-component system chemotaxis response regulator CheY